MRSSNKRSNGRRTGKASTVACSAKAGRGVPSLEGKRCVGDRGCPEPPAHSIDAGAPADGTDGRSLLLAVEVATLAIRSYGANKNGQLVMMRMVAALAAKHGGRAVAAYLGSLVERPGAEGRHAAAMLLVAAAVLRSREVSVIPARLLGQGNDGSNAGVREREGSRRGDG